MNHVPPDIIRMLFHYLSNSTNISALIQTSKHVSKSGNHDLVWKLYFNLIYEKHKWPNHKYYSRFQNHLKLLTTTKSDFSQVFARLKSELSDCILVFETRISEHWDYYDKDICFFINDQEYLEVHEQEIEKDWGTKYKREFIWRDANKSVHLGDFREDGYTPLAWRGISIDDRKKDVDRVTPDVNDFVYNSLIRSKDLIYSQRGCNLEKLAYTIARRYAIQEGGYDKERILSKLCFMSLTNLKQTLLLFPGHVQDKVQKMLIF